MKYISFHFEKLKTKLNSIQKRKKLTMIVNNEINNRKAIEIIK